MKMSEPRVKTTTIFSFAKAIRAAFFAQLQLQSATVGL